MPLSEFQIIENFFNRPPQHTEIQLGPGDDAAITRLPPNTELVSSVDTMVEGIHFLKNTAPFAIGYKALAMSLSDLAAMGAKPLSVLATLTMPTHQPTWLTEFAAGFFQCAEQFKIDLIGGDLSHGPLSISTMVNGTVPVGKAILRSGAQANEHIYVSGYLGDAGLALDLLKANAANIPQSILDKLNQPTPRVNIGLALRDIATAMIDLSDGLVADLKKLLARSQVGATVNAPAIPLSNTLLENCDAPQALQYALSAGDDYELCFTCQANDSAKIAAIAQTYQVPLTCIGTTLAKQEFHLLDAKQQTLPIHHEGYDHFKDA